MSSVVFIPRNLAVPRGQMPPTSLCSPPDDLEDDSERESGDNSAGEVDSDTKHLHEILNKDLHSRMRQPNRQKHHRNTGHIRSIPQNSQNYHSYQNGYDNYQQQQPIYHFDPQSSNNNNNSHNQFQDSSSLSSNAQPIILQSNQNNNNVTTSTSSTSAYE